MLEFPATAGAEDHIDISAITDFVVDTQRMLLETVNAFEFDSLHQLIPTSSSILFIERLSDCLTGSLGFRKICNLPGVGFHR